MRVLPILVGTMQMNCYLYVDVNTNHGVCIDPGFDADRIAHIIEETGVILDYILLTHGHFDHIGAVDELRERYGVKVVASEREYAFVTDSALNGSEKLGRTPVTVTPDICAKNGDVFGGLTLIETPGHTVGSVCYYNADDKVLFSGDTLFAGSVGRTDFPTGDYDTLMNSLKNIIAALPDDTRVYPGHNRPTTIGAEKAANPYFK